MSDQQYATLIMVNENGQSSLLERIPVSGEGSNYNEAYIQKLAFEHPNCLPINEIDCAYEGLIPVCCELNTPAGPLDILYVTPKGRLVITEAKLWRNPEARRKVVGQVLDYAKELSVWDYEDLQREVSRATGKKGNALFHIVAEQYKDIDEADLVDEVTRSLNHGRFLLLIIGDGIREGVGAIANFLENVGNLEFTLGLVELALYKTAENSVLVQPRVLAKTVIIKRSVVSLKNGKMQIEDDVSDEQKASTEPSELEKFYLSFWPEMLNGLELDDPSQPPPKSIGKIGNIFYPMPPSANLAWLSVYFYQQKNNTGVFLTFRRGSFGDMVYEKLLNDKDNINKELGKEVEWESNDGKHTIGSCRHYDDLKNVKYREEIKVFLREEINLFVNVFRPRLEYISNEL